MSDVISWGNCQWCCRLSSFFSGYTSSTARVEGNPLVGLTEDFLLNRMWYLTSFGLNSIKLCTTSFLRNLCELYLLTKDSARLDDKVFVLGCYVHLVTKSCFKWMPRCFLEKKNAFRHSFHLFNNFLLSIICHPCYKYLQAQLCTSGSDIDFFFAIPLTFKLKQCFNILF